MKIYYIYHSCFITETKSSFLIFDYYKSKPKDKENDFDFKELLSKAFQSGKTIYVFVSHSHSDHYNSEILSWSNKSEHIYYVLSDDVKIYQNVKNFRLVAPDEEITVADARIRTFSSTDAGVSFLVSIDGLNIFHSGDLNWWKWNDDTLEEERAMENSFKDVIEKIAALNTIIDVAFFPVDGRLEENYLSGGEYFIEKIGPKLFIPMHFWESYDTVKNFINSQSKKFPNTEIVNIDHPNHLLTHE